MCLLGRDTICRAAQNGPTQKATGVTGVAQFFAHLYARSDTFWRNFASPCATLGGRVSFPGGPLCRTSVFPLLDRVALVSRNSTFATALLEKGKKCAGGRGQPRCRLPTVTSGSRTRAWRSKGGWDVFQSRNRLPTPLPVPVIRRGGCGRLASRRVVAGDQEGQLVNMAGVVLMADSLSVFWSAFHAAHPVAKPHYWVSQRWQPARGRYEPAHAGLAESAAGAQSPSGASRGLAMLTARPVFYWRRNGLRAKVLLCATV